MSFSKTRKEKANKFAEIYKFEILELRYKIAIR